MYIGGVVFSVPKGTITLATRIVAMGCVPHVTDALVGSPALTSGHAAKGGIALSTVTDEIKTNPIALDAVAQGMHSVPQHFISHFTTK